MVGGTGLLRPARGRPGFVATQRNASSARVGRPGVRFISIKKMFYLQTFWCRFINIKEHVLGAKFLVQFHQYLKNISGAKFSVSFHQY